MIYSKNLNRAIYKSSNYISSPYKWKKCEFHNCTKQPSFGPFGGTFVRCATHKKPDDINIRSPKCEGEGCLITPCFGPMFSTRAFRCLKHKLDSDINLKKKECEVEGCTTCASFGPVGTRKMLRCYQHKFEDDINTKKTKIIKQENSETNLQDS